MKVTLSPTDRATRQAARQAHDEGRHGDGTKPDVVTYWALICADCHAIYRYEVAS